MHNNITMRLSHIVFILSGEPDMDLCNITCIPLKIDTMCDNRMVI
jgi:hypothetical protein